MDTTSPVSIEFDCRWNDLRTNEKMNFLRVKRLANVLHLSEYELASALGIPHDYINTLKQGKLLPFHIAVFIATIEQRFMRRYFSNMEEPVLPI